jgi:hypothetical protein
VTYPLINKSIELESVYIKFIDEINVLSFASGVKQPNNFYLLPYGDLSPKTFRFITNPNEMSVDKRIIIGINLPIYMSSSIEVMFWIGGHRVTSQEFLEKCPEPYKSLFLFNLDLIT